MLIAIDGNEANIEGRVGIGQFAYEVLSQFAKLKSPDVRFEIYLKRRPVSDMPRATSGWAYKVFGPRPLWTQLALPYHLYREKPRPDVFFTPSHYAPRFSPVPTVVSIMDLSYLFFPEYFKSSDLKQLKSWTAYSVKKAARVVTISNSTKDDIIAEYGVLPKNVSVVYSGIKSGISLAPHIYSMEELKAKYGIKDSYILFVGTLQPRKNISRLIEAFSYLSEKSRQETDLVIVGKKGWLYEDILAAPRKFGVPEQVKFLDFVPDDELGELYKHAQCYVLPSLYEGFGLPVLEAMQYGCPVITSKVSSLPEAGGDAVLYVDPENSKDIAEKIEKLLSDNDLRKKLIDKGKLQVKKFSWEKTARETLAVLKSVGEKSS